MIHDHDHHRHCHHHTERNEEGEQEEDLDGGGDGFADEARVGLPRAEPYRGDLSSGVQFEESNSVRHIHAFLEARVLHAAELVRTQRRTVQREWECEGRQRGISVFYIKKRPAQARGPRSQVIFFFFYRHV